MSKFARLVNNVAVDVVDGDPAEYFHPDIAAQFEEVPSNVEAGWVFADDVWSAGESSNSAETEVFQTVGVIKFKLLFTSPERVKAKELRASDALIDDFWSILDDPRTTEVDLNLSSIQNAIEYTLTAINAAGIAIDVGERKADILSARLL
ncbi:hypothetical protein [Nitrosomonas supralitoralis]|uniref:Uncharacterized protein n=1 Tax=Nitrosomonas supralitoralis TaxID=2116706 RepID=A0A2P7NSI5_9PROT|nr:hypothetical protein [Nitrosomonas supralitoralis]PSJ16432.1 hypothetical protein C7H79_13420 [Nitrosomonas supralitoralis]